MEVDRKTEVEKWKERSKEENHVLYMQTDGWQFYSIVMLFYSNIYGEKGGGGKRESVLPFTLWKHFGFQGIYETFLSFNLYVVWIFVIPTTIRNGFAKCNDQVKTVELHIYDKHHTIFTIQYINSLAFLDTYITI